MQLAEWALSKLEAVKEQDYVLVRDALKLLDGRIRAAMAHCLRVLKPGRWLSLCYHDTSEGTWSLVQDIMAEVGFVVDKSDSAVFIDTNQKSYNQYTADTVVNRSSSNAVRTARLS
jgi:hypothetical protein